MRLDIRRIGAIKERDEVVGNQTRVKVVKNKMAPPFKQVEFDIMYGEGVSKVGELIDLGVKAGVVEKSGAWFSYDSQRIGQGRENAKQFLKDNPDMAAKIEAQVRQNAGLDRRGDPGRRGQRTTTTRPRRPEHNRPLVPAQAGTQSQSSKSWNSGKARRRRRFNAAPIWRRVSRIAPVGTRLRKAACHRDGGEGVSSPRRVAGRVAARSSERSGGVAFGC